MSWFKGLFGGNPKPAPKKAVSKKAVAKTYLPTGNRAAVIAEAMAVHQRERTKAQGVLEQALKEMQANPPRTTDIEGMTRLLTLRQAVLAMKGHMAHDLKRYQVLAGVQNLLESDGKVRPAAARPADVPKSAPGKPPPQGAKR